MRRHDDEYFTDTDQTIGQLIGDEAAPRERPASHDARPFVDPPDDESLVIRATSSQSIFYRLTIADHRLTSLVAIEPTVPRIALAMRNNQQGCWLAFTSQRVADRVTRTLQAAALPVTQTICDLTGQTVTDAYGDRVVVTEPRPWTGGPDVFEPAADEFFYCVVQFGGTVRAFFVPETFWNQNQIMFPGSLGIDRLLPDWLAPEFPGVYSSLHRSLFDVKVSLDHRGFRENLMFLCYVNSTF